MIQFQTTIRGIDEVIASLKATPEAVDKAIVSACNKLAAQGVNQAKKSIAATYNAKPTAIKDALNVIKAQRQGRAGQRLFAVIHVRGRGIPLYQFKALPKAPARQKGVPVAKRKPTSTQVLKAGGRTVLPHQFIARMKSGHVGVFRRTGKGSTPIKESYSISVPTMFEKQAVKDIRALMDTKGRDVFRHELSYYLGLTKKGGA